jgi:hypothetical protein
MIKCNAGLFRIATSCQSKEAARFYLQGVFVEPHGVKGVTLTSTDGHRLVSIYDENGFADEKAIISLSPAALKECKATKHSKRILVVDGANASVYDYDGIGGDGKPLGDIVAVSPKCKVDGVFPDWRRVVPKIEYNEKTRPAHFDGSLLSTFCDIAADLMKEKSKRAKPLVRVLGDVDSPAVVLFANDERAFGILMPVTGPKIETLPWWFSTSQLEVKQAAE